VPPNKPLQRSKCARVLGRQWPATERGCWATLPLCTLYAIT